MNQDIVLGMKRQMCPSRATVDLLMQRLEHTEVESKPQRKVPYRWIAAASMVLFIATLTLTPVGRSFAKQLKIWFTSQWMSETIEGEQEKNIGEPAKQQVISDGINFNVYVNMNYFQSIEENGVQKIFGKGDKSAKMTIEYISDMSMEECLKSQLKREKVTSYEKAEKLDLTLKNVSAFYTTGNKWNSRAYRIYCIENTEKGGCYLAKYTNTIEEEEGYAARFHNVLNTFQIV